MSDDASIEVHLARLAESKADETTCQPLCFDLASPSDQLALRDLVERGSVAQQFDTLMEQLHGLIETRHPDRRLAPHELTELAEQHLGGTPRHLYGVWVYFPWSRRLVHVLPEKEFVELRTSRNRNKITREEQAKLRSMEVAVAGLSVGSSTALTLALEGVGGTFRLADFDRLELSNMNRLRAGVHHLNINKAVLTAREIYELDPFMRVEIFSDGVTKDNIEAFLGGDKPVDLLFEECDDLSMKIRLRERARDLRIPVLMETSDRGLIDVERFDQEPNRPLLHGLVGNVRADDVAGLTTYEKVPIVLRIIGADTMSKRMAASLVDIETTLKTWPQLASSVTLGGALNTDVARRVALGEFVSSGRYYVDMEQIVDDAADGSVKLPPSYDVQVSAQAVARPSPRLPADPGPSAQTIRALVELAVMAPSGGNCQPWRFVHEGRMLYCMHDEARSRSFLDFGGCASHLAIGAAVENIVLAAPAFGVHVQVEPFPNGDRDPCVAALHLGRTDHTRGHLFDVIPHRVTNRRLGERVALSSDERTTLLVAAEHAGATLQLLETPEELDTVASLIGGGDRVRFLSNVMHREMMSELRWSPNEVERTRDGIDVATLEMSPTDLAGMRLVSNWSIMDTLDKLGGGAGLEKASRKAVSAASAVGFLTLPGFTPQSYFLGGRALQRVWLTATAHGLGFQPLTALLYMFARLARGSGFNERERTELGQLRSLHESLFGTDKDRAEVMLFRVAHIGAPSARSLRRNVDDVLDCRGALE